MKSYYKVGSTYRTSHRTSFSVWQSEKLFCMHAVLKSAFMSTLEEEIFARV